MGRYSSTWLQLAVYAAVLIVVLYASTATAQIQTEVTGKLHMYVSQQMYNLEAVLYTVAL